MKAGVPYFRNETVLEWQLNRSTLDTAEDVQGSRLYQITSSGIALLSPMNFLHRS